MRVIVEAFAHLCIVVTVAVAIVVACRFVLRRLAGANLAYASWSLVPVLIVAFVIAKGLPNMQIPLPTRAAIQTPAFLTSSPGNAPTFGIDTPAVLLLVWLIGACVMAAWIAMRQYQFVCGIGWLTTDQRTRAAITILRASSTSAGPFVFGLFRPRIVIPADFYERYSEREQRLVLAHELAHVRGGDLYANAISVVLQIVF